MFENHGSIFGRLMNSFGAVIPALFLFICVIALGEVFHGVVVAKRRKEQGMKTGFRYRFWRYVFYLYLMMVYIQTGMTGAVWWAGDIRWDRIYLIPFTTSPDMVPYMLNVLMTIPLGFLLPLIWPSFRSLKKVVLAGFLLSFSIEFMQLFSFRVTSTSDLIMNTLGAVIGYGIFALLFKWAVKGNDVIENEDKNSKIIKYEAAVYLALSFIGAVLLYHPRISTALPQWGGHAGTISVENNTLLAGEVIEVLEDRIRVRLMEITILPDGSTISASDNRFLHGESVAEEDLTDFFVTADTQFTIFSGTEANLDSRSGTFADISFGDLLNIVEEVDTDGRLVALEVQVWRVGAVDAMLSYK